MNIEEIYKKLNYEYFYSPYNGNNWTEYPHLSGRTVEMLLKAVKRLLEKEYIYIISESEIISEKHKSMMINFLKKLEKLEFYKNIEYIVFSEFLKYYRPGNMNWKNIFIDENCLKGKQIKDFI